MDIARLNIQVDTSQTRRAEQDLNRMTQTGRVAERGMSSMRQTAMRLGAAVTAAFSVHAIQRFARTALTEFADLQRSQLRLTRQIENMGYASWISADQVEDMASRIDRATLMSAEGVRQAASVMLASNKTTEESFERSMNVAVDMAEVLEMNLPTAARYLTRAMGDTTGAMSMFRRYGVELEENVQDQIEALQNAGRESEAYELLLEQLEGRFKGAAEAAGEGLAGSLDDLSRASREAREVIGGALAPAVAEIVEQMTDWVDKNQEFIGQKAEDTLYKMYDGVHSLYTIYSAMPEWMVGPAGFGILGAFLFGGKVGLIISAAILIERQMAKLGMGIKDLAESYNSLKSNAAESWEVIKGIHQGERDFWTGELLSEVEKAEAALDQLREERKGQQYLADEGSPWAIQSLEKLDTEIEQQRKRIQDLRGQEQKAERDAVNDRIQAEKDIAEERRNSFDATIRTQQRFYDQIEDRVKRRGEAEKEILDKIEAQHEKIRETRELKAEIAADPVKLPMGIEIPLDQLPETDPRRHKLDEVTQKLREQETQLERLRDQVFERRKEEEKVTDELSKQSNIIHMGPVQPASSGRDGLRNRYDDPTYEPNPFMPSPIRQPLRAEFQQEINQHVVIKPKFEKPDDLHLELITPEMLQREENRIANHAFRITEDFTQALEHHRIDRERAYVDMYRDLGTTAKGYYDWEEERIQKRYEKFKALTGDEVLAQQWKVQQMEELHGNMKIDTTGLDLLKTTTDFERKLTEHRHNVEYAYSEMYSGIQHKGSDYYMWQEQKIYERYETLKRVTGNEVLAYQWKYDQILALNDEFNTEISTKGIQTAGELERAFTGWGNTMSSQLNEILWKSDVTFKDILRSFAKMITQMMIQRAIVGPMMGGVGGWMDGLFATAHTGGVIGRDDFPERKLSEGLRANEYPTILERDEVVFTKEQMKALSDVLPKDALEKDDELKRVFANAQRFHNGLVPSNIGSNTDKPTNMANVEINVINKTGTPADASVSEPKFEGDKWVMSVVLDAAHRNRGGFAKGLKTALGKS